MWAAGRPCHSLGSVVAQPLAQSSICPFMAVSSHNGDAMQPSASGLRIWVRVRIRLLRHSFHGRALNHFRRTSSGTFPASVRLAVRDSLGLIGMLNLPYLGSRHVLALRPIGGLSARAYGLQLPLRQRFRRPIASPSPGWPWRGCCCWAALCNPNKHGWRQPCAHPGPFSSTAGCHTDSGRIRR